MEPQGASANRLERFTNASGTINFHSWKQLFIASINAKGLENALQAQDEDALNAPKLLTANKADALLLFELLSSIDKEPRQWVILNYPITEQHIQWAGFSLWQAIKKRYEQKAIPQPERDFGQNEISVRYRRAAVQFLCSGTWKTSIAISFSAAAFPYCIVAKKTAS